ncbi:MAG: hypothetical protein ACJATT_002209 [Myxococcota bacterium]|jgi:uncharacterized protein YyaL (SSP411 family)
MFWPLFLLFVSCSRPDVPVEPPAPVLRVASETVTEGEFTNRLITASSPYLLQHAHNPVDWRPWGDEAFAEAARRDVPVFLSIGYAACHWCHVMEEESFEDPVLAAYLNAHFVTIKVDREERPDVDAVYMDAVHALNGSGGWPASIWLTPDRKPFLAGTYYPPVTSRGRPGFREILERVTEVWSSRRGQIDADAERLVSQLTARARITPGEVQESVAQTAMLSLLNTWDSETRGWGQKKFPMTPRLEALLGFGLVNEDAALTGVVRDTLWAMDRGGVHDQLGGGFHRYTVDPRWQIPHFEKMLYDNGQLLSVYASASVALDEPRFAEVADGIAAWMMRELTDSQTGAFYSSQDADTQGEEGTTYTWTPAQMADVLGDDASAVLSTYAITARGNFEGATVLTRPSATPIDDTVRDRLMTARLARAQPATDTKMVVSYNALAIAGLARGGRLLNRAEWVVAAERAATAVLAARRDDGSMPRTLAANSPDGVLDDYAFTAVALMELYEATGKTEWLTAADSLVGAMDARLWDPASGTWFMSADTDLLVRKIDLSDGPEPSGVARAVQAHQRLDTYGTPSADITKVTATFMAAASWFTRSPAGVPTLAMAHEAERQPAKSFVVVGRTLADAEALAVPWSSEYRPDGVLALAAHPVSSGASLLTDKTPGDAAARAFLCFDGTCQRPVSTPAEVRELLDPGASP